MKVTRLVLSEDRTRADWGLQVEPTSVSSLQAPSVQAAEPQRWFPETLPGEPGASAHGVAPGPSDGRPNTGVSLPSPNSNLAVYPFCLKKKKVECSSI